MATLKTGTPPDGSSFEVISEDGSLGSMVVEQQYQCTGTLAVVEAATMGNSFQHISILTCRVDPIALLYGA